MIVQVFEFGPRTYDPTKTADTERFGKT